MIQVQDANSLIVGFSKFSTTIVYVLIGVAVIFIIWNGLQFIRFGGDSDKRGEYQSAIIWGIIGLAVIMSIWGLVAILKNTFVTNDAGGQQSAQNSLHSLILKQQ
jgi:uncharacterized membrane protein YuzA (DUF378 family)